MILLAFFTTFIETFRAFAWKTFAYNQIEEDNESNGCKPQICELVPTLVAEGICDLPYAK